MPPYTGTPEPKRPQPPVDWADLIAKALFWIPVGFILLSMGSRGWGF